MNERRPGRVGLGALGGLALAASFPPWNVAPLAVAGPALLLLALRGQRALLRAVAGLAFGLCFGVLLAWAGQFGVHAWGVLALGEAAFAVLLGIAAGPVLGGDRPLVAAGGWAGLWVLVMEVARARFPFGGFPWGPLGAPFVGTPVDALAPVGSALAMSAAVAFAGALLALAVRGRLRAALAGSLAVVALVGGSNAVRWPAPEGGGLEVAVVQGNVPFLRRPPHRSEPSGSWPTTPR